MHLMWPFHFIRYAMVSMWRTACSIFRSPSNVSVVVGSFSEIDGVKVQRTEWMWEKDEMITELRMQWKGTTRKMLVGFFPVRVYLNAFGVIVNQNDSLSFISCFSMSRWDSDTAQQKFGHTMRVNGFWQTS